MTAKTRRRHSAEFQANAVRKLNEPGQSAQALADELEVRPSLLYRWRRAAQAKEGPMTKKKPPPTNESGRRTGRPSKSSRWCSTLRAWRRSSWAAFCASGACTRRRFATGARRCCAAPRPSSADAATSSLAALGRPGWRRRSSPRSDEHAAQRTHCSRGATGARRRQLARIPRCVTAADRPDAHRPRHVLRLRIGLLPHPAKARPACTTAPIHGRPRAAPGPSRPPAPTRSTRGTSRTCAAASAGSTSTCTWSSISGVVASSAGPSTTLDLVSSLRRSSKEFVQAIKSVIMSSGCIRTTAPP